MFRLTLGFAASAALCFTRWNSGRGSVAMIGAGLTAPKRLDVFILRTGISRTGHATTNLEQVPGTQCTETWWRRDAERDRKRQALLLARVCRNVGDHALLMGNH